MAEMLRIAHPSAHKKPDAIIYIYITISDEVMVEAVTLILQISLRRVFQIRIQ